MFFKSYFVWQRLTFGLLAFLAFSATRAQTGINRDRMQRDLDIMEGVLSKLLLNTSERGFWNGRTQGMYFDGYGVIFQVDYTDFQIFVLSTTDKRAKQVFQMNRSGVFRVKARAKEEEETPSMADRIANLKEQIVVFLANYADAIGQLRKSDRITVLVNLGSDNLYYNLVGAYQTAESAPLSLLEATVRKSDIVKMRQGQLSESAFRKRIVFKERAENDKIKKNVEIMANIMDTALSKKYHQQFGSGGKTKGIYLDGVGVIFFMKGEINPKEFEPFESAMRLYIEAQKGQQAPQRKLDAWKSESDKRTREVVKQFKSAVVELVGDYGHTLRNVKPSEFVVVAVDFNNIWEFQNFSLQKFIVKIKKKDLDAYNRGKMKLAELRKKVEFQDF
ncbi:MAG: hypothetical protein ACE5HO_07150 [bacterium]